MKRLSSMEESTFLIATVTYCDLPSPSHLPLSSNAARTKSLDRTYSLSSASPGQAASPVAAEKRPRDTTSAQAPRACAGWGRGSSGVTLIAVQESSNSAPESFAAHCWTGQPMGKESAGTTTTSERENLSRGTAAARGERLQMTEEYVIHW